jgi:hypothetical protein
MDVFKDMKKKSEANIIKMTWLTPNIPNKTLIYCPNWFQE